MRRWKDRLATLFLVVAIGLSLLPWVYQPEEAKGDPYVCEKQLGSRDRVPTCFDMPCETRLCCLDICEQQ
ncbi:hypothetical protein SAMN04488087_2682 [Rhodothermus profundi]|uniref:Uncharacterized protein n=1 Tax=Rhodothermus profundi TaxID=633813 RepID=A0A1M6XRX2_9BACT|nr:hypothetical protein SAMN04488087_2682 [Rhodothermus profundi]